MTTDVEVRIFELQPRVRFQTKPSTFQSGRGTGGSLYRPQPLCPLRHGEEPSENTTIASQQPPSYDSVSKDNDQSEAGAAHLTAPPPPYKP